MVGTMALIVILSVFNGFDSLVRSLINSFNPDIKIEAETGKTFIPDKAQLDKIRALPGVYDLSLVLEDKALVRYDELQTIAVVKGVDENYVHVTGIDSMMVDGDFSLRRVDEPLATIGRGIRIYLNVMPVSPRPLVFYVPRRSAGVTADPVRALNRKYISVGGVFSIEQDYDLQYIIVPLDFARDLFEYNQGEVSMIEAKLTHDASSSRVQQAIIEILGDGFKVLNRYQQNEVFYKTMQSEKWAIFFILFFILIVASFNVIGTLTMLMLEKKKDAVTLQNLGADLPLIRRVFRLEGWLISASGAILGILLGLLICWIQMRFGVIKLQGSGSFIIDSYPVVVKAPDVIITLIGVVVVSYFTAWYPIRYFTAKYLAE